MCGISGFYSKNLSTFNNVIIKMNSTLKHRGPERSRVWQDNNSGIVFGHQRLSILDLSSMASQPMQSEQFNTEILFNGEIFNHKELRKELENNLVNFSTNHSDTEVVLLGLSKYGKIGRAHV